MAAASSVEPAKKDSRMRIIAAHQLDFSLSPKNEVICPKCSRDDECKLDCELHALVTRIRLDW